MYRVLNQVINRSYVALQDGEMFLAEKNLIPYKYHIRIPLPIRLAAVQYLISLGHLII